MRILISSLNAPFDPFYLCTQFNKKNSSLMRPRYHPPLPAAPKSHSSISLGYDDKYDSLGPRAHLKHAHILIYIPQSLLCHKLPCRLDVSRAEHDVRNPPKKLIATSRGGLLAISCVVRTTAFRSALCTLCAHKFAHCLLAGIGPPAAIWSHLPSLPPPQTA